MNDQQTNQSQLPTPVKFQYLYFNGDIYLKKVFSLKEILEGLPNAYKIAINNQSQKQDVAPFEIVDERQFTGMVLTGGTEIFHKDILKLICPADNGHVKEYITSVEFEAYAFVISTEKKNDCFLCGVSDDPTAHERSYIEVLGNTTENPEFLIEVVAELKSV